MRTAKKRQAKMIEALMATKGHIGKSCRLVGITRKTHYDWLRSVPDYKEMYDDVEDDILDFSEEKLHDLIDGVYVEEITPEGERNVYKEKPCKTCIIFKLKTKGKKRGYGQEEENVSRNIPVILNIVAASAKK